LTSAIPEDKLLDTRAVSEHSIASRVGYAPNAANLRKWVLALVCLCVMAAAADICTFGLMDKDEGTYAAISRTMVRTGNYLVPTLSGSPWFEKPPLLYWTMALAIKAFGPHAFSVRVPSVLAFLVILALLAWWGDRRIGKGAGPIAALIFALSPLVMGLCRLGTTDMLLCCCLTTALIALWEIPRRPVWCVVLGVSTGLAVLAKGPVGLGFVGLQALMAMRLLRGELRSRWLGVALLIAVAVSAPWYVCVCLTRGSAFFQDFIVRQNLLRFAGGDAGHAVRQPLLYLLYYVFVLWLGVYPWSALAPDALRPGGPTVRTYLRGWSLLVFGFFTLAITKLPSYVLPALPAMALLIADRLVNFDPSMAPRARMGRLAIVLGGLVWVAATTSFALICHSAGTALTGFGLAAIGLAMWGGLRRGGYVLPALVCGSVIALLGAHFALSGFDSTFMAPPRTLALKVPAGEQLAIYRLRPPHNSIYFYRSNRALDADKDAVVTQSLLHGAYCLAESKSRPKGPWVVVDSARGRGKLFVLLRAKR
jgi:4-amino-4-deoxy-L-arabinose transferase-like glycosyltransferase